ncbi:hypothetical protein DPMN_059900 [Dreissena polymorpha]|uniref:Uncharacterized protein n=1 Tax=Dreissena polymorpha TaxID=45954 RepID=A0A9D4HFH3_DREPO|nr:hypothetical protein DPMN_059900 [Dreissena polymorpha]
MTLSALHTRRRSRVPTLSNRRRRILSDVSGHSSSSDSLSKHSSSASTSPHHYRNGHRARSPSPSLGIDPFESDHANVRGDATPGDLIHSVAEQCFGIAGIRDIAPPHISTLGPPSPIGGCPLVP